MKSRALLLSVLSACAISAPILAHAEGSEVRNGGDIRRLRARLARDGLASTFATFSDLSFRYCERTAEGDRERFDALNARVAASKLWGELRRTGIRWVETPSPECVARIQDANGMNFELNYASCLQTGDTDAYRALLRAPLFADLYPAIADSAEIDRQMIYFNDHCAILKDFRPVPRLTPLALGSAADLEKSIARVRGELSDALTDVYARSSDGQTMYDGWLEKNVYELKKAVQTAEIRFGSEHAMCGYTEGTIGAPIHINLSRCQGIQTWEDLEWVFMHEATHQVGVDHEDFADEVATTVWEAILRARASQPPVRQGASEALVRRIATGF